MSDAELTEAPVLPKREELIDDRRQQILAAAVRCISQKGFDGVRLREVSREAGVSIGLIQHHFETRDELLANAIRHASAQLSERFQAAGDKVDDPWQRIVTLVDHLCSIEDIKAHGRLWLEFAGAASKYPELRPQLQNVYQTWYSYVRRSVDEGVETRVFRPTMDVVDAVAVFMAFFDGYEFDIATGLIEPDLGSLRRRSLALAEALFQPHHTRTSS